MVAQFVEKGVLDYDEKVSTYWPEFAQGNKENVTLSDLVKRKEEKDDQPSFYILTLLYIILFYSYCQAATRRKISMIYVSYLQYFLLFI